MTGCPVELVLYDDGHTQLIKTVIQSPMPLRLKVLENGRRGICAGRRVMLLSHYEGIVVRADGHLDQIYNDENGQFLEIGHVHWELLERRRHIRVPVTVPVTLRTVMDGDVEPTLGVIQGTTMDISISGAFVKTADLPEEGSLVEFCADLDGETVRTLAVVAHITRDRNGVGLHFVEYLENARPMLHAFLTKAA